MIERLSAVEPRTLAWALAALVGLAALAAWLYLLKPQLADYRQVETRRSALQADLARQGTAARDKDKTAAEVAALSGRLSGSTVTDPAGVLPRLMSELEAAARGAGVRLGAVAPAPAAPPAAATEFDEAAFDAEAQGSYPALAAWLAEAEERLHPLVVTQAKVRVAAAGEAPTMQVRLAGFRLRAAGGAK